MSGQTTFDQFIKVTSKHPFKRYFYLDWTQEKPRAKWLATRPNNISFEANVKWRDRRRDIVVCGYNLEQLYDPPFEIKYNNISLLKSHLQKCVRRQLTDKALKTSWHMIKMDLNEFIRRLPIIMIEDVQLHESMTTLVWLMSAISKGYEPSESQIHWVMGLVKFLCEHPTFDRPDCDSGHGKSSGSVPQLIKKIDESDASIQQKDILYSMLFRQAYGGMKGDMNMFYNYTEEWLHRFENGNNVPSTEILPYNPDNLTDLDLSELEISAVDFHCFPRLLTMIVDEYPDLDETSARICIWECNSKINTRIDYHTDQKWIDMWKKIKDTFGTMQATLLDKYH